MNKLELASVQIGIGHPFYIREEDVPLVSKLLEAFEERTQGCSCGSSCPKCAEPDADTAEAIRRAEVLSYAIRGVENAKDVGYSIHKSGDVAGHVLRALREAGYVIARPETQSPSNDDLHDTVVNALGEKAHEARTALEELHRRAGTNVAHTYTEADEALHDRIPLTLTVSDHLLVKEHLGGKTGSLAGAVTRLLWDYDALLAFYKEKTER